MMESTLMTILVFVGIIFAVLFIIGMMFARLYKRSSKKRRTFNLHREWYTIKPYPI